jgi:CelD/BcsL family acetyltransferase involved in cellulose biosynthesis
MGEATLSAEVESHTEGQGSGFTLEVVDDLSIIEAAWRTLEERTTASPYQRFDWIRSFRNAGVDRGTELRVLSVRDGQGRLAMILPLSIARQSGFRIGRFVGGKHANFKLPLTSHGSLALRMNSAEQRSLLLRAGRQMGLDAFDLEFVPRVWDGEPVALAEGGRPSPSNAYSLRLVADGDAALKRAMSPDGRRKLRNKENTLRKLGAVEFQIARDAAEVQQILDAFFEQKADRFREQGIRNPFTGSAETFIREASLCGLQEGRPAIELYALVLNARIIAAFGAAADARRISGMFISFDPEFAKWSPGDQLVAKVVSDSAGRGRAVFDLGVGEAEYKSRFCREVEELVDVLVPVNARGQLYAAARMAAIEMKRRVKQSGAAMDVVRALRGMRARVAA